MTLQEKEQIRQMRIKSGSYKAIAAALGLSENTIKSFCQRNMLGGRGGIKGGQATPPTTCLFCGKWLIHEQKRKPRKFCSDACRRTWWKENDGQIKRKAYYSAVCAYCGKTFVSYGNSGRKFCSHSCYVHYRYYSVIKSKEEIFDNINDGFGGERHDTGAV